MAEKKEYVISIPVGADPDRKKLQKVLQELLELHGAENLELNIKRVRPSKKRPRRILLEASEQVISDLGVSFIDELSIDENLPVADPAPAGPILGAASVESSAHELAHEIGETLMNNNANGDFDGGAGEGDDNSAAQPGAAPVEVRIEGAPSRYVVSPKRSSFEAAIGLLSNGGANLVLNLQNYSGISLSVIEQRPSRVSRSLSPMSTGTTADRLLVEADKAQGDHLAQQSLGNDSPVWFEENVTLTHFATGVVPMYASTVAGNSPLANFADHGPLLRIKVTNSAGDPLPLCKIQLHGLNLSPIEAFTRDDGVAELTVAKQSDFIAPGIVIEPPHSYWSKVVRNAGMKLQSMNTTSLLSFEEFDGNFFDKYSMSWGVDVIGASSMQNSKGAGISVAVIDSGCDNSHPLLNHVRSGANLLSDASPDSWVADDIGHGTHCTGVIGANGADAPADFMGLAPNAKISSYKIFPDGDFFVLADAVETAVADGADIINMSLGSAQMSNDVRESIDFALDQGVAVIVATGNSSGPIMFPANLSSVFSVGAVGNVRPIPRDSTHSHTMLPSADSMEGYFSANFSCFGNEIDFCAPGVGVISAIPNGFLKAMDGTSMAAPHVSGLAAVYLSSHPRLKTMQKSRARVEELYSVLTGSAKPFAFGRERVGHGMPRLISEALV